jgi:hypothetical protein
MPAKPNKCNFEAFHWRRPDFRAIRTGQLHFRALWTETADAAIFRATVRGDLVPEP